MDIDDFLELPEFKKFDDFLTTEMNKTAGDDLISRMKETFGEPEIARDWFYSSIGALRGKRPYDYCKSGRKEEIRSILGRIEYGIY
jgi:hypothetical protein